MRTLGWSGHCSSLGSAIYVSVSLDLFDTEYEDDDKAEEYTECCGLNTFVPQLPVLNPDPQGGGAGGGGLWEQLCHEEDESCPLKTDPRASPLLPGENTETAATLNQEVGLSRR